MLVARRRSGIPVGELGTSIVLHPPAADPGITDDEHRTIVEMMAKGTVGVRDCAVRDPAGNLIRIQVALSRPAIAAMMETR